MGYDIVKDTLAVRGMDADSDLGLWFRVSTPAKKWIGCPLCGPVFRFQNLAEGLRGWGIMRKAWNMRDASKPEDLNDIWLRVRRAHIEVWAAAGRSREKLCDRLDALRCRMKRLAAERAQAKGFRTSCGKNPKIGDALIFNPSTRGKG